MSIFSAIVTKKDTQEFVNVAIIHGETDTAIFKKLRKSYGKNYSFDIKELEEGQNYFKLIK